MPKDESDPEDPLELCGVGLLTEEDTSETMTECFVEEFMRLGHPPSRILALFRNPHYTGMNMVFQNRGETFIRDKITEVFDWWKHPVSWDEAAPGGGPEGQPPTLDVTATDPMGAVVPQLD